MDPFWHALWMAVEMGAIFVTIFVTIAVLGVSVYALAVRPRSRAARGGMQ